MSTGGIAAIPCAHRRKIRGTYPENPAIHACDGIVDRSLRIVDQPLHLALRQAENANPIVRLAFGPDQDSLVVDPGAVRLAVVAKVQDFAIPTVLEVEQPDLAPAGMAFVPMIEHEAAVVRELRWHVAQALRSAHDPPDVALEIMQIEALPVDRRPGAIVPACGVED